MLKKIRLDRGLLMREMAEKVGITRSSVGRNEKIDHVTSTMLTKYINNLELTPFEERELKTMRKDNWEYDPSKTPLNNEMVRVRNGLGLPAMELSRIIGRSYTFWAQTEFYEDSITEDDLDQLDKHFNLSSTTIRRLRLAKEYTDNGRDPSQELIFENPDICEPLDLYDGHTIETEPETYLELLHKIEDENDGSILNASENDPKMIRLREMMGVIYHDRDEEHGRVTERVDWNDVL